VTEDEFARLPGFFGPGQRNLNREIPALAYRSTIDSLGFRGENFPRQKPPGELRILAIGDSFTFGSFVEDDETLPARIEAEFMGTCLAPVRVINAGVGGTTIETHAAMAERGLAVQPDLVVLTFYENDVVDLREEMWRQFADNRRAKSRFPLGLVYPLLQKTALWDAALKARVLFARRDSNTLAESDPGAESAEPTDTEALRERYAQTLATLTAAMQDRNIPVLFVIFPSHLTVEGTWTNEQVRWVSETARSAGLSPVDLLPVFLETGLPVDSLYLLPHDGHARPRTNSLAAAVVADRLREVEPLASRCGASG
jgi:lysophospholipase L1-like esterase